MCSEEQSSRAPGAQADKCLDFVQCLEQSGGNKMNSEPGIALDCYFPNRA